MQEILSEIQLDIERISHDLSLFEESNFESRVDAIDFLEFHVLDRIEYIISGITDSGDWLHLKQEVTSIIGRLEKINEALYCRLRSVIQSGQYSGSALLKALLGLVPTVKQNTEDDSPGYDAADILLNGLLPAFELPEETRIREPEMVYYQKTPARIIFQLVSERFESDKDVFYDLGSGLGQVCILMNLLTGIRTKGVEFEPQFCDYARRCARDLNTQQVDFINEDARSMDYGDGTVFYLYTPFTGTILNEVLDKLKQVSEKKTIRFYSFGPVSLEIAKLGWLRSLPGLQANPNRLSGFISA